MFYSKSKKLTNEEKAFLVPKNTTHRQYEALRAFFVDKVSSAEVAKRFGYSTGSFRVLCSQFRKNPNKSFFLKSAKGPKEAPKKDSLREKVVSMRKQNFSVYDIQKSLFELGKSLSIPSIASILKEEGFSRLLRRRDEERPNFPRPEAAPIADVRQFALKKHEFRTKFGGLFLFLPLLAQIPMEKMLHEAEYPGTKMIPSAHAIRSLLALKLFGNARYSHVMSYVFDEGLALFAGLNAIPKRSFLTEYSCRVEPASHRDLMARWFGALATIGLEYGVSFDLDFHTIPFHGEDALVQKHYVSKRSRRQKGILAFLVWDGEKKHFCYANADVRKEDQNDEILRFVEFWEEKVGRSSGELVFDSKLTTYKNLSKLNEKKIQFITLRRRSKNMLRQIHSLPESAWRKIELSNVSREYKTPKIINQQIQLQNYKGPIRQIAIVDLGHEQPTFLLTNQMRKSAKTLVDRYAKRMIIENSISDNIDFFHMDALSSSVAMKVDLDLQLTLMASSLYRLLGAKLGNGYETAKSRHIFRDIIDMTATVCVTDQKILIKFQKKAHNPILMNAGFHQTDCQIGWWGNRHLQFQFG